MTFKSLSTYTGGGLWMRNGWCLHDRRRTILGEGIWTDTSETMTP